MLENRLIRGPDPQQFCERDRRFGPFVADDLEIPHDLLGFVPFQFHIQEHEDRLAIGIIPQPRVGQQFRQHRAGLLPLVGFERLLSQRHQLLRGQPIRIAARLAQRQDRQCSGLREGGLIRSIGVIHLRRRRSIAARHRALQGIVDGTDLRAITDVERNRSRLLLEPLERTANRRFHHTRPGRQRFADDQVLELLGRSRSRVAALQAQFDLAQPPGWQLVQFVAEERHVAFEVREPARHRLPVAQERGR